MSATYYMAPECAEDPEACASYGNLHPSMETWRGVPQVLVTVIDDATGSDYSGGTHTRSNYEVMLADPDMRPHLIDLHGNHGTYGLAYRGTWDELRSDLEREALRNALVALEVCPVLDDNHHSELETRLEGEAWESDGRRDFAKALAKVLDELDPDHDHDCEPMADDVLADLWFEGCEAYTVNGGVGCSHSAEGCHFYIDEWCGTATNVGRDLGSGWGRAARAAMRDKLVALAPTCRVQPDETEGV